MSEKLLQSAEATAKKPKRYWRLKNFPRSFIIRATDEEHQKLKTLAKRTGLSLSRLVIEGTIASSIKTSAQKADERAEIEEIFFELKRININLNQINSALHAAKRGEGAGDEMDVQKTSREIETVLNKLRKKL